MRCTAASFSRRHFSLLRKVSAIPTAVVTMPPFQPVMHQRGEPSPPARPRLRAGLSLAAISTPKTALDPASYPHSTGDPIKR